MPPPQQAQFTQLPASVTQIIDRLNPSHPSTPFQAALYNVVPPSVIEQYTKPAAMHSALWHAAQSANPNPSCQVPVHANGIDDLLLRAQTQSTRVQDHAAVLQRLRKEIADIQTDVASELYTKLSAYRRRHRELARKLLRIAASVDVNAARAELHHQNQQHISIGLSALETERRKKLENTVNTLTKPAELKDKLYDLVELAPIVKGIGNSSAPVTIRDRRAADAVRGLLSDQLEGIQQLGIVCSKIERDMSIMARHEQDPVR